MPRIDRAILWGALFVLTVAAAAWAIGHFSGGYGQFVALARPITATQWGVLAVATACFYLLDYARLYTLFAILGFRIPLAIGIELTCVSYFVSSLTPTAELNIPAMMLMLRQRGIPPAQTAAVAVVKTFYVTFWICVFGFATLLTQHDVHLPQAIADHIVLFTAPAFTLLAAFFYVVFFPDSVLRWTSPGHVMNAEWKKALLGGIHNCARALGELGQSKHPMHLASHLACIAFILIYVFIGGYLCHALGISLSPRQALTVFSNSLLIAYLSPVPGSIGVAEVLTSYLLDPGMSERSMVASTLLRILCAYAVAVPGVILLANAIRKVGWQQLQKYLNRKTA